MTQVEMPIQRLENSLNEILILECTCSSSKNKNWVKKKKDATKL